MRGLGSIGGGSGSPVSFPEMLFREFRAGKINEDVYHTQTSVWVAENANQYSFRAYQDLPQVTREYIRARNSNTREQRDPEMHKRVGRWLEFTRSVIEQNTADLSLLIWCKEKLLAKNLIKHVELLERKSEQYLFLPPEYLSAAAACQLKDSRDKGVA